MAAIAGRRIFAERLHRAADSGRRRRSLARRRADDPRLTARSRSGIKRLEFRAFAVHTDGSVGYEAMPLTSEGAVARF